MSTERFVLLGLARVRSPWFRDVAQWAQSAALPIEFVKAVSADEVRVRLRSGRSFSALLVDESAHGLDRDLVELALTSGCAVVIIGGDGTTTNRADPGASARLSSAFTRDELLHLLHQVARSVSPTSDGLHDRSAPAIRAHGYRGHLVAVTGPAGAGRSTVAMALAQGLASDPRHATLVCLADLALHAHHAMLHDAGDVAPGLLELVEAHRSGTPSIETVRHLTARVESRGYHLLIGLRRHRDWTALRPRAIEAAVDSLQRAFRVVVADVDDDLEGEQATGSFDVEERNALARTGIDAASVVCVVGGTGLHGIHGLLRVTRDVLNHGVSGSRIVPIINRAPRGPRGRAELTRAYGELLSDAVGGDHGVPSPVHLVYRRRLEDELHDGLRLHGPWVAPACGPVVALLDLLDHPTPHPTQGLVPLPVAPGSLGSWSEQHGGEA